MSIIRLEWEDAVAALLNILCKDRIHDFGSKGSKNITNTGLAGGSSIVDEALKVQVLNALYKITYKNNDEEVNIYCITQSGVMPLDISIIGIRGNVCNLFFENCSVDFFNKSAYNNYILSDTPGHEDKFNDDIADLNNDLAARANVDNARERAVEARAAAATAQHAADAANRVVIAFDEAVRSETSAQAARAQHATYLDNSSYDFAARADAIANDAEIAAADARASADAAYHGVYADNRVDARAAAVDANTFFRAATQAYDDANTEFRELERHYINTYGDVRKHHGRIEAAINFLKMTASKLFLFVQKAMCINIFDIKPFCNKITDETTPEEKNDVYTKCMNIIISQFNKSILEKILKYLYVILNKLKFSNKVKLFHELINLYNEIFAKEVNGNDFTNENKACQLIFIQILQLIFLKYMSYYICKQICIIYGDLLQAGNDLNDQGIRETFFLNFKDRLEIYLLELFGAYYKEFLSKNILNILYNSGRLNRDTKIEFLSIKIKKSIDLTIDEIIIHLFSSNDYLIIQVMLRDICIETNVKDALSNIIEEKQIQVSLSFFFYDMLDDYSGNEDENNKNNELINETIGIYKKDHFESRHYPIPTKIGDIGFLLRMITSNIEKLQALKKKSEIVDDVTIKYLYEMRDILIKIFKKQVEKDQEYYTPDCREALLNHSQSYGYYINYIETRLERGDEHIPKRIDYTFEDIFRIVKDDILQKIQTNNVIFRIKPSLELVSETRVQQAEDMDQERGVLEEYEEDEEEIRQAEEIFGQQLSKKRRNSERIRIGGKKILNNIISYNDIYYIIQSNLRLYNTSNNYYGGGVAEDNWHEMLKKFTIMALGMNNLTPNAIPPGTPNGGVNINHADNNYNKFVPSSTITYGFNDPAENNDLFSDWFNFEKLSIYGNNNAISKEIEKDESTFMKRLFIKDKFSIFNVIGAVGAQPTCPIIDDLMSIKPRFLNLVNGPTFNQHGQHYDWFKSPPINIQNTGNLQELKLQVTPENSYANVKFPIYDEEVFNNDIFPLISKNIKDLSRLPYNNANNANIVQQYKMKYVVNNEATSISAEVAFNILNNYATFSDPGGSGSDITKLLEYGEKYIMGFYGITRILITGTPINNYLEGIDITPHDLGSAVGQVTELITDGYTTVLNPRSKEHTINIYSTQHNNKFNLQTPNNQMATYECKRLCTDFGVGINKWTDVSLAVALQKSLDVLKRYMDSFIGKFYLSGPTPGIVPVPFINTPGGTWKVWQFLFNDYGVYRGDLAINNDAIFPINRKNTEYKSIPSPNIDTFIIGIHIAGGVNSLPVWDNTITLLPGGIIYLTDPTLGNNECWLRLPCFSIFNQISIFKGNGDLSQELYTLTKFGGIYQNNSFHKSVAFAAYNPDILDGNTLNYLNSCEIYPPGNYSKFVGGVIPPLPHTGTNFYGAGAYKIQNNTDDFNMRERSISDRNYIPYDRFGNAPRAFVSGDRLSGLRYIMLSFLGLKYFIRRICNNTMLTPTSVGLSPNQQLFNNINILSFGGYNSGLLSSTMSKPNKQFIFKLYSGIFGDEPNQIYNILRTLYPAGYPAVPLLPIRNIRTIRNYATINTGGGKKSKTYKKKKLGKKGTKKILKKYKKTIKKNPKKKFLKSLSIFCKN
jgi:hypothetical protein